GLDLRVRLPAGHDRLEMAVREAMAARLTRGAVTVNLNAVRSAAEQALRINRPLLDQLIDLHGEFAGRVSPDRPRLEALLAVRGVVEPAETVEEEAETEARHAAMLADLASGLTELVAMRAAEGVRLAAVLRDRLGEVEDLRAAAAANDSLRPAMVRERMRAQIADLLDATPMLNEERLAQEVALLTAKGDVREELDRLAAHVAAGRDMLAQGGAVGRRLDFLCQELNREANTICSKAADLDLTRIGLALKAAIEQFREQVQNLE
ncbi:MAG: YicC/YloC family endoribonuclease, partial [Alphaproteobacteria bacterium]